MEHYFYRESISPDVADKLKRTDDVDAMMYFSDGTVGKGFLGLKYDIPQTHRTVFLFCENKRNSEDALLVYPVVLIELSGSYLLIPASSPEIADILRKAVNDSLKDMIKSTARGLFKKKPVIAADPEKELIDIRII